MGDIVLESMRAQTGQEDHHARGQTVLPKRNARAGNRFVAAKIAETIRKGVSELRELEQEPLMDVRRCGYWVW